MKVIISPGKVHMRPKSIKVQAAGVTFHFKPKQKKKRQNKVNNERAFTSLICMNLQRTYM